jgi:adenylosuccinate synthase
MMEKDFAQILTAAIEAKNETIVKLYGAEPLDAQQIVSEYTAYAERLRPYVRDTGILVHEAVAADKTVLFEGAQGSMLDIDLGTYPYVTSSHPISGGFTTGSGIGAGLIGSVIGITKAYTTRVGEGPFVTELEDETGELIRERGHEYGVTTGRPRRCGWFDAVVVKYAVRINGITGLSLMLLDVLDGFDEIKICYSYECEDGIIEHYPASLRTLEAAKPVYKTMKGWNCDITSARTWDDLPEEAKAYVEEIEKLCGAPVEIISVGPGREQTIMRGNLL